MLRRPYPLLANSRMRAGDRTANGGRPQLVLKGPPEPPAARRAMVLEGLEGPDVLRLRALLPPRDLELDPLVLGERPEAGRVDRREVDEQVSAAVVRRDE